MALESVTNIGDLVPTNPTPADPKSAGDDHIRNIKTALLNAFAGFTGSVLVTGVDGGAANACAVTPSTALQVPAYVARMGVVFSPVGQNTGACTLNISGLGAKPLRAVDGQELVAGDLVPGSVYTAVYTGSEFRLTAPTKNYIDQKGFISALPGQSAATAGMWPQSQGASNVVLWAPVPGNSIFLNNNFGGL